MWLSCPWTGASDTPVLDDSARARRKTSLMRVAPDRARKSSPLEPGSRLRHPLQRLDRRHDEERARHERRDRVARQAEDERRAPNAERERLARLDGHAPEHLLDPELTLDPPHEVVRADGHASRRDEDVELEAPLDRLPVRVVVVASHRGRLDVGAGRLELRREHGAVRLVDLTRPELRAGRAELGAGRDDGDSRAPSARHLPKTGGADRADLRRPEPCTRGHDLGPGSRRRRLAA